MHLYIIVIYQSFQALIVKRMVNMYVHAGIGKLTLLAADLLHGSVVEYFVFEDDIIHVVTLRG